MSDRDDKANGTEGGAKPGAGADSADAGHPTSGCRRDGRPYKEGNTRDDGGYRVGRNRTPEASRFRKGDGRPRGRRKKGTPNADAFFEQELARRITIREDGRERRVTKGQGVDVRLISNAGRGDNRAIELVDARRRRIAAEKEEAARRHHTLSDAEILHQYLKERADELGIDPGALGDPAPDTHASEEHGDG